MTLLGLTCSACQEESSINKAWKKMVKRFHPDKHPLINVVHATQHTQRLNEAKEVLLKNLSRDVENQARRAELERQKAALQAQEAAMKQAEKNWADLMANMERTIRKEKEAAANSAAERLQKAHEERAEYERTFKQRMRDIRARCTGRKRPRNAAPDLIS